MFTIKLYHGGELTRLLNMKYIDGTISYIDTVNIDELLVHQLDIIMKGLGYAIQSTSTSSYLIVTATLDFMFCVTMKMYTKLLSL